MYNIFGNKGQLTALVEAICKDFRGHDEGEIRKLVEWQRVMKTRGATHAAASCAWTARWAVRQTTLIVRYLGMP